MLIQCKLTKQYVYLPFELKYKKCTDLYWLLGFHVQVRFDSIGGLGKHISALKEMVVFPLLYPEVFEKFKIQPPRYEKRYW